MKEYSDKSKTVYYFGTCLMDMFYPEAGMAGINLIRREGIRVVFPREQTCCGQPAYNSGFFKEAKKVALKQIGLFAEDYPIVVPSGSCAGMMKHHYPYLFADDPNLEAIKKFSSRIVELSEFLVKVLKIKLEDRGRPIRVTWHSSCHALREMSWLNFKMKANAVVSAELLRSSSRIFPEPWWPIKLKILATPGLRVY